MFRPACLQTSSAPSFSLVCSAEHCQSCTVGTAQCWETSSDDSVGVAARLGPGGTLLCCALTERHEAQVPLRRVNQAYVIATSTSVDVGSVDVAKFDDAYFLKPEKKKEQRTKKGEENFFQEDAEKTKARTRSVTSAA